MLRQLEYALISQMSSVSSKVSKIFKEQWTEDRKAYNKFKDMKEPLSRSKERVTRAIMGGTEITPERGLEILEEFKGYANRMIPHVSSGRATELENVKEEADAVITAIRLIEHAPSAWASQA